MYGLVNQAIRDLIIKNYGESKWEQICSILKISPEEFIPIQSYPDELTFDILKTSTELLNISNERLLNDLGDYWITFTAEEGYGDLMAMFGRDFRSCLNNLNRMHSHIGAMMPELNPPRFIINELGPKKILVHYYSVREGLAPMVIGLLHGLARKFGNEIQIIHFKKGQRSNHDEFEVTVDYKTNELPS